MFNAYRTNSLEYSPESCTGCKKCVEVCPHAVFAMNRRTAVVVRKENCMECGACQMNCAAGAIKVESGVGCAYAMMRAALTGKETAACVPSERAVVRMAPPKPL